MPRTPLPKMALLAWCLACLSVGCRLYTPPDPNDPRNASVVTAAAIRNSLAGVYDALEDRRNQGDISEEEVHRSLVKRANEFVDHLDLSQVPSDDAWQYGEIFRTAERWDLALSAFDIAVRNAKTQDRRVNDSLRLAQCFAKTGNVPKAIATARTTFDAAPSDKAAILPAVLLDIVPAAAGKGQDAQVAKLLEDAIGQHVQVVVDPSTEAGAAFMLAKPFHIRNAWARVIILYRGANDLKAAVVAEERARAMMRGFAHV